VKIAIFYTNENPTKTVLQIDGLGGVYGWGWVSLF